jgi:6-phosphofructokinase 1
MKTLLVVSGGDSPGINTALLQYTRLTRQNGDVTLGTVGGFPGALAGQMIELQPELIAPLAGLGGSYLASSREPVLKDTANRAKLSEILASHQIDNIILFGGDGTLRHIPPILAEMGIGCVGIPTTIDNDVPGTDMTIGFDSACNFAHHTIDGLLATARALPGRIFSVETLGGNTGMLALDIAVAAGANAVLVPEYAYTDNWLIQRLEDAVKREQYALVILSEGIAAGRTLVDDLKEKAGLRIRDTRLGHGQRGTSPSHRDRILATEMANAAYEALQAGKKMGTLVVSGGKISLHAGKLADLPPRLPDQSSYNRVNEL